MFIVTYGRFADLPQDIVSGVGVYTIASTLEEANMRAGEYSIRWPGEAVAVHDCAAVWPK